MLQIQGRLLNTFFKPNGFCVNLLTQTFRRKKTQIPYKSSCCWWWWHISDKFGSMSREEQFRSVPRATRSKRSVGMRAQKQVVSGQSLKSNAISVFGEQPNMLLVVFYFQYLGNPCQGMKPTLVGIVLSAKV